MKQKIKDISEVTSDRKAMDFLLEKSCDIYESTNELRGTICIAMSLTTKYWEARKMLSNHQTCTQLAINSVLDALKPKGE